MNKFAIEISYNSWTKKLGILVEAKDSNDAISQAQKYFFKIHPNDCILSTSIMKIDITLINTNPSNRNAEEKA